MRPEQVLAFAVGAALLLAAVSALLPHGVYGRWHDVLYAAAAAWILASVLYRAARGEPLWRVNLLGALLVLGIISAYMAYAKMYAAPASLQIAKNLETLEEARQMYEVLFAQTAAHTAVAASAVITAAVVIAPFTLGLSVAVALLLVDLAVDVVNEFMSTAAGYLGFAYAAVSVLVPVVKAVEAFPAVYAPVAAAAVPSKRTVAVAAYVAAIPLLVSIAVATAPGLPPVPSVVPVEKGLVQPGSVRIETNAPVVVEFKAPYVHHNGTHWVNSSQWWWYTVLPPGGNLTLPNGTWTLTRYIYMWTERPVGVVFTIANATYGVGLLNYTGFNSTVAYFYPRANRTFVIALPYSWTDGWSAAASQEPKARALTGGRLNATWVFEYRCYGTAAECPGASWTVHGLAAVFHDLAVAVRHVENAEVDAARHAADAAMREEDWERICNATSSAVMSILGAGCAPWHPTKAWGVEVEVRSTPVVECRQVGNQTVCEEVAAWHAALVSVSLLYSSAPMPAVSGFQRGLHTTRDLVDLIFGYALYALTSFFPLLPGAVLAPLAAKFVEPFAWIWGSLIPWALRLVYTLVAVTAGAAGLLVIVGAGAPALKLLGISQFFQLRLRAGQVESALMQLASRGLAHAGRGASAAVPAAEAAVEPAVKPAAEPWLKSAQMLALYASSALRWATWLWRFDPLRLVAALSAAGYVGSKTGLRISVAAPHPRLQPLADALAKVVEYSARYLKGMHLLAMHSPPLTPEGQAAASSAKALDWLWATTHLRLDWYAAKAFARVFHKAYELTQDLRLAAAWSLLVWRPPRHTGDIAAFMVLYEIRGKPLPVLPGDLVEGFRRFGFIYTEEQAAALYLRRFGYDYSRLKAAWEAYRDYFTRNTYASSPELLVSLPAVDFARSAMARFAVERLKEGDPRALYFSPIPEFRKLAAEELGVEVTPEGGVKPIWDLWLRGASRAVERGDVGAVLRLAPGPMGQRLQLYEPSASEPDGVRDVMMRIVEKAAARGVGRDVAEAGVWKMLEDPQARRWLGLDYEYRRLEDAIRRAVEDVLPREVVEAALPQVMRGDVLRAIYEVAKEDRAPWYEGLPEHVQAAAMERLPYGDWSYAHNLRYALELADVKWREVTPDGQVVERSVVDFMPRRLREAVEQALPAYRLAQLESMPPTPVKIEDSVVVVDYAPYVKIAKAYQVDGYEVAEGGGSAHRAIRPEDLAALGRPEEVGRMLAEAARFSAASAETYDEGYDFISRPLSEQLEEVRRVAREAGADEEEAARRLLAFYIGQEYADLRERLLTEAMEAGEVDVVVALHRRMEEAERLVEAARRPEGAPRAVDERLQPAPERYVPVEERYVPADVEEPVEDGYERVDVEVGRVGDEDHVEAVRRILGIDLSEAPELADLPRDVAERLVEEFGPYAGTVAENVRRVDGWMRQVGVDDETRHEVLRRRLDEIAASPEEVIRDLAEEAARRAPRELQDLVAEDLAAGRIDEVNWKLANVMQYCASKGGCSADERRDMYRRL